jgi:hypothetical protein
LIVLVQGEQYVQSRQRVWGEFRAHRKFQTDREEEERKGGREEETHLDDCLH